MDAAQLADWPKPIGTLKTAFNNIPFLRDSSPGRAPIIALVIYVFCALGLAGFVLVGGELLVALRWWAILFTILFLITALLCVGVMWMHEHNKSFETFKVSFFSVPNLNKLLSFTRIVIKNLTQQSTCLLGATCKSHHQQVLNGNEHTFYENSKSQL